MKWYTFTGTLRRSKSCNIVSISVLIINKSEVFLKNNFFFSLWSVQVNFKTFLKLSEYKTIFWQPVAFVVTLPISVGPITPSGRNTLGLCLSLIQVGRVFFYKDFSGRRVHIQHTHTHTYMIFVSTNTNKTWLGYHWCHSEVTMDSGKKTEREQRLSKGSQIHLKLWKSLFIS